MDTLYITVPREQSFQFLTSLKKIEKRQVAVEKSEHSTNCETPQVRYRSTRLPGSAPDSDKN
jgi:hypothetical protein